MKALVVFGSITSEDRYGRISGERVAQALKKSFTVDSIHAGDMQGYLRKLVGDRPDLVVPVGFGPPCEDGHIFAAARLAGIPCAGPTPAAGALMQDKNNLSRVVGNLAEPHEGIRSPRGFSIRKGVSRAIFRNLAAGIGAPFLVKPNFSGSSEGLGVFHSWEEAYRSALGMVEAEGEVLVQELEHSIECEISCTMLDTVDGATLLPIVELITGSALVMDKELKFGPAATNQHIIPARLHPLATERIAKFLPRLHDAVGAVGLTRTDILVLISGDIVVLEMNGIPGLLPTSIACDAAKAAGIEFDELALRYAMSAFLPRHEPNVW